MRYLKKLLKDFFYLSNKETNGILILIAITCSSFALPYLFNLFYKSPPRREIILVKNNGPVTRKMKGTIKKTSYTFLLKSIAPFPFNPNTVDEVDLKKIIPIPYLVNNILKYRNHGGKFYSKSDFKKIYGMPDSLYQYLSPYIQIPEKKNTPSFTKKDFTKKTYAKIISPFDLNLADTSALKQIKGIGSKLSSRIIHYKNKLGGFITAQQIYEVYGLDSAVIETLLTYAYIDQDFQPEKLSINQCSLEQFNNHPYIDYTTAKLIVAYRNQHGPFQNIMDLKKIKRIDEKVFYKIEPYIKL